MSVKKNRKVFQEGQLGLNQSWVCKRGDSDLKIEKQEGSKGKLNT